MSFLIKTKSDLLSLFEVSTRSSLVCKMNQVTLQTIYFKFLKTWVKQNIEILRYAFYCKLYDKLNQRCILLSSYLQSTGEQMHRQFTSLLITFCFVILENK